MLQTNKIRFFDAADFEKIIHCYFENGNTSMAKRAISLALEQHPASIDIKLMQVRLMILDNQLEKAKIFLNKLIAIDRYNEEAYIQMASLLSKKNNHKKAIKYLKIAQKHSDDLFDTSYLIGMEYLYLENYEKSRNYFLICLKEDLDDYKSFNNIIHCFEMEGKRLEAVLFLEKYIDRNPYSEIAWHQLGKQYFSLKNYTESLKAFDYMIVINEYTIEAYMEKAKALEKLNRYDEAIGNYNYALKLDDDSIYSAYIYFQMAECYKIKKKFTKSIFFCKKALYEDPLLDKAWISLAVISKKNKNYKNALVYTKKAISLDETNLIYWKHFAFFNAELKRYKEAIEAFENCIQLGTKDIKIFIKLSEFYLLMEKPDKALDSLLKAKKVCPSSSKIAYRLARVIYTLNQKGNAFFYSK